MPRPWTLIPLALAIGVAVVSVPALAGAPAKPLSHVSVTSPTGSYAEGHSLVNGRLVNPAGTRTTLGDFPVGIVVSPDGRTGVVANSGQGQGGEQQGDESLQVIDLATARVVQTVRDHLAGTPTFYNAGLAFSRDGKHLYATGGGNDAVYDYAVKGQRLSLKSRWKSSVKAGAPTVAGNPFGNGVPGTASTVGDVGAYSRGLALGPDGTSVIVANEEGSTVAALSTTDGQLLWETPLGAVSGGGAYPQSVTVSGTLALVPAEGLNAVAILDATTGALTGLAPVGDHPTSVAAFGGKAWVTNANDDSVSVLDLTASPVRQVAQYSTHLVTGEANGSTPTAVAVDATHVYVTLAGDNAVLVLDHNGAVKGAIPTGWYPSAVALNQGKLLVAAAKGLGSVPVTNRKQYDGNDMTGLLTQVPLSIPLEALTGQARWDLLYPTRANALRPKDSPIPDAAHEGQSPIKHIVMVVRENRTFDQVFGDLPHADADKRYLEYGVKDSHGKSITPNAHAIAARFGLSQNFYSDGEASQQGHFWTAEGVSTDFDEKSWLYSYSNRNRPFDSVASTINPRCGAEWQQLSAQGKTFKNFGELVGISTSQPPTAQAAPGSACTVPGGTYDAASLAGFSNGLGANATLTSVSDVDKEAEFEREYTPLIAAGQMPQFSYVVMGNDHTEGTAAGKLTPQAHVATNDLGVGKLVDFLSHSKAWASTAVFVVEDDSQDGMDHRDGHRNIALLASPYARKGALSSTHISQTSILRTMELVLGVQPISSYTQYAAVPYDLFTSKPDLTPYTAITPTYDLNAVNPPSKAGSAAALPLDLSDIDRAGPLLEAQNWEATHPGEPMPETLLHELATRAGVNAEALSAWRAGVPCLCNPRAHGED
ncbi:MAG: beta-propeller repeat protein [Frankiales bacterium]|nr:beta-propeller repeat protein [Frankiales bacterium]